jgi:plasmid stabilization system protein ParE
VVTESPTFGWRITIRVSFFISDRKCSRRLTAFVLRLEEQIRTLECFPERCPLVPENELLDTSYRHLLHGNYRTLFKIVGSRVIILRVLHGARLLDTGILEGLEK